MLIGIVIYCTPCCSLYRIFLHHLNAGVILFVSDLERIFCPNPVHCTGTGGCAVYPYLYYTRKYQKRSQYIIGALAIDLTSLGRMWWNVDAFSRNSFP